MKKYTVAYQIASYYYESEIRTSSSAAAFLWVDKIGGYNAYIVKEEEIKE